MNQDKPSNVKYCQLKLSFKKHPKFKSISDLPKITTSKEVTNLILEEIPEIIGAAQEIFIVVFLNRSNRLLAIESLFKGGISATIVDVKVILKIALSLGASGIILCHNHPSGQVQPSDNDKAITCNIKIACKSVDLTLMDHLIVCDKENYYSFADNAML